MKKFNIEITYSAERDLYEIGRYIAEELLEPAIAVNMIRKVSEAIISSEVLPFRNALVADEGLASRGIRKIAIENYIIFYICTEEQKIVTIIRILYGKREWEKLIISINSGGSAYEL